MPIKVFRYILFLMPVYFLSMENGAQSSSSDIELYTVKDIAVDVTADCAKTAQERAMSEGRIKAFKILVERLLSQEDYQRMGDISPEKSDLLIRDYEVVKEKHSPVRYVASLIFRFDPAAVKRFLESRRIEVSATPKNPVLVIPLLVTQENERKLWHDNPWLLAWASQSPIGGITPLIIPLGDLADITDLDTEHALNLDQVRLTAIAQRYGASGAMVVRATTGKGRLEIEMALVSLEGEVRKVELPPIKTSQAPHENIYRDAITRVVARLDALGKDKTDQATSSQEQHLPVEVILNSPQDWAHLQRCLSEISTVSKIRLKTLSRKHVLVDLTFFGSILMLESALGVRGFNLTAGEGNSWIISAKIQNSPRF